MKTVQGQFADPCPSLFTESLKSYKEIHGVLRQVKTGSSVSNSVMSFKCSYTSYWNHDVICHKF